MLRDRQPAVGNGEALVGAGADAAICAGRIDHRGTTIEHRIGHCQHRIRVAGERYRVSPQHAGDQCGQRRTAGQGKKAPPVGWNPVREEVRLTRRLDALLLQSTEEWRWQHLEIDRWILCARTSADVGDVRRMPALAAQGARERHDRWRHGNHRVGKVRCCSAAELGHRKRAGALHDRSSSLELREAQCLTRHQLVAQADRHHRVETGGQRSVHQLHGQRW